MTIYHSLKQHLFQSTASYKNLTKYCLKLINLKNLGQIKVNKISPQFKITEDSPTPQQRLSKKQI